MVEGEGANDRIGGNVLVVEYDTIPNVELYKTTTVYDDDYDDDYDTCLTDAERVDAVLRMFEGCKLRVDELLTMNHDMNLISESCVCAEVAVAVAGMGMTSAGNTQS
jgi:hypothetical protein